MSLMSGSLESKLYTYANYYVDYGITITDF